MKKLLYLSASLFFLAAAGFLVALGTYVPAAAGDLHKTMATYQKTGEDLDRTTIRINQVLVEVHGAAAAINQAASSNQKYYQQIARQAAGSEKALRLFLDRTDRSLNDQAFPALNRAIADFDKNSQNTLSALDASATAMGATADSLNRRVSDPAVTTMIENLTAASADWRQTSVHVNSTSASVDRTVNYYEKKWTAPTTFAKRLAEWSLDTAAKIGDILRW